ncbi:MAG TPA: hypothetical protein VII06_05230 [Chloroflexota bacterium]
MRRSRASGRGPRALLLAAAWAAAALAGGAGAWASAAAGALAQAPDSYPFTTLPPGSALPSDAQCTAIMDQHRDPSFEPRPENDPANHTNVYQAGYRMPAQALGGYGARVTGDFAGTTDEILQWAACKWGFDADTVRAQAMQESGWDQGFLGDCGGHQPTQPETHGCASVGIMQVKGANLPPDHANTYPYALISTAFNVDYTLGARRQCYEGRIPWLNDRDVRSQNGRLYGGGDEWGCMGFWYSGRWYDRGAQVYLYQRSDLGEGVQNHYQQQTWLRLGADAR